MTKSRRWVVAGCVVVLAACVALLAAPFMLRGSSQSSALKRWAQTGGANYTLVVYQMCFCPDIGEWQLTVQNGQVTAIPPLVSQMLGGSTLSSTPQNLSDFDPLTVEGMFARSEQIIRRSPFPPFFSQLSIAYDPIYGYVSRLESDANGMLSLFTGSVSDSHYTYTARDLQLTQP